MIPTRLRPALAISVVVALNALVWAAALVTFGARFPGATFPIRSVVAEFLSTSALLLMSTNLLLTTRARPLEALFSGLDKLFTSHRFNGVTVAFIVAAHCVLVPKPLGWFRGSPFGVIAISAIVLSVLVAIAPRAPWRRLVPLRYQDWKLLHRFMGLFVALAVLHSLTAHPFSAALPLVRVWVYGVGVLGLLAYVFRETVEPALLRRHHYRVGEPSHLPTDVLDIPLLPISRPIEYRAGQFAFLRFADGPSREQHPFTISAAPSGGALRFSVKSSGDYTRALQTHLARGSAVLIEGPYGRFDCRRAGPRQLWVAGGIGITPFLAFLPALDGTRDVELIWSVRSRAEAAYLEEVEAGVAAGKVRFTLHESTTIGHLDLAAAGLERAAELSVLLCGPVPMRKALIGQLLGLGVARDRIYYEEFTLR